MTYLFFRATEGFKSIESKFPGVSIHIPLNGNDPTFQSGASPSAVIESFHPFKEALDKLPRPTAVICQSNRRASAVLTAYQVNIADNSTQINSN